MSIDLDVLAAQTAGKIAYSPPTTTNMTNTIHAALQRAHAAGAAEARELLLSAYNQLDPIYLADGVTLHPGCVSTLHDLYAYLWPEGKRE